MPDLVTHTLVPYFFLRVIRRTRNLPVILFGAILPDFFGRPLNYLFIRKFPFIGDFSRPFHTPLVTLLCCVLVALLFEARIRGKVFKLLLAGSFLHLGMDILQKHIGSGYYLLFPFSRWRYDNGIFWSEEQMLIVPYLVLVFALLKGWDLIRSNRARGKGTERS